MTASIDINNPDHPKRVLMVAANPSTSTQTGWPVGFWWAELTHPYWEFTEHGYQVDIASPDGGTLTADGFSDPEDESGYSAHDLISLGFKHSAQHAALIEDTPKLADLELDDYHALFLVGGQSPMFTFRNNPDIETAVRHFYETGKPTAIVCHATSVLLDATTSTGERIVTGKTWTGFANAEEAFADNFVGQKIQPYWIEDEAKNLPDTNFVVNTMFKPFAIRDGNLITGQQQYSGTAAARLVIETLGV